MDISIEIGALSTALVGALAAGFGLFQYRKAEAWKRAEFTGRLFEQLSSDDELAFACKSLDWGAGTLIIPAKYRVLFIDGKLTIGHDWNVLADALKRDITINIAKNPNQLLYRYSLDALCDYLDRVRIFVVLGLVELSDLGPLGYYAALMLNPRYYNGPIPRGEVLGNFIMAYYPSLPAFLSDLELLRNPKRTSRI
jgi:hypothetical protein